MVSKSLKTQKFYNTTYATSTSLTSGTAVFFPLGCVPSGIRLDNPVSETCSFWIVVYTYALGSSRAYYVKYSSVTNGKLVSLKGDVAPIPTTAAAVPTTGTEYSVAVIPWGVSSGSTLAYYYRN